MLRGGGVTELDPADVDHARAERPEVDLITRGITDGGITDCIVEGVVVEEQQSLHNLSRHRPLLFRRWKRWNGKDFPGQHLDDEGGASFVVVHGAPDRLFQLWCNSGFFSHISCPP
ncbi:MAG: hypothetical protein QG579_111 [Patescibacteria group bacterium]|nr:hypothetical protein [Patescibacteria group bacterium]